jgi:hypothetical protein
MDAAVILVDGIDAAAEGDRIAERVTATTNLPLPGRLFVVEQERAAGKKRVVEALDRFDVLFACAAEAEDAAAKDRLVATPRAKIVELRDPQRGIGNALATTGEHVNRRVTAVRIEALVA